MSTSDTSNKKTPQIYSFRSETPDKFSAYQPIDIKPVFWKDWILNGVNNSNFKIYRDAYDDSPTNASIINAYVRYIFAEGLIDKGGKDLTKYISEDDAELMANDLKMYGGYSAQVIWNSNDQDRKPLRIEYLPVYKCGIGYNRDTQKMTGVWFSYDWTNRTKYKPEFIPEFTGTYVEGQNLESIYVRRATPEPYFPLPDYLSGIPWAQMEGQISNAGFNHFKNSLGELTIINYNGGEAEDEKIAQEQADKVRKTVTGTEQNGTVLVSYNDGAENATTVDRVAPAELSQHNTFYSEEAERKLIVAHSAPPILFAGSNQGTGFSSNADEREIAMKQLYRTNINPFRKTFLNGLKGVFKLIDPSVKLDFKDFDSETELDTNSEGQQPSGVDDATQQAQATLKGSVGGVQALLEVQRSYAQGLTDYDSAIAIMNLIFGFTRAQGVQLLGEPKPIEPIEPAKTNTDGANTIA